ncbi:hypothetical protein E2C01_010903 [Portunus trituberculatus]|uniref:Uncharacterized protein n=1 Tax=Portunus trituberculatus TaxID=210409 RepID=A0A5B7D9N6_PORTR|nr:hypothetical protein [Portunus trituberculatus]
MNEGSVNDREELGLFFPLVASGEALFLASAASPPHIHGFPFLSTLLVSVKAACCSSLIYGGLEVFIVDFLRDKRLSAPLR